MANLGLTTTINSSTVNDVRLVYLRNVNLLGNPIQGQGLGVSLESLGFNTPWGLTGGWSGAEPSVDGVPNMNFNNYSFAFRAVSRRSTTTPFRLSTISPRLSGRTVCSSAPIFTTIRSLSVLFIARAAGSISVVRRRATISPIFWWARPISSLRAPPYYKTTAANTMASMRRIAGAQLRR